VIDGRFEQTLPKSAWRIMRPAVDGHEFIEAKTDGALVQSNQGKIQMLGRKT